MPSFLIVGAGAIGGFIGGMLARQDPVGNHVVLIARGPHYHAMKKNGGLHLTVNSDDQHKPRESFFIQGLVLHQKLAEVELKTGFDVVFLCVKAHQLQAVAEDEHWRGMINPHTRIITLQNGLPWFLFLSRPPANEFYGRRLTCVDPGAVLERAFPSQQVVGGVAMPACHIESPGVIVHTRMWQLPMSAKPDFCGGQQLCEAGFDCQYFADFESELWLKILGSAIFNPVSALTGATLGEFSSTDFAKRFTLRGMEEVRAVAKSVGVTIPVDSERRLRGASKITSHKTSMLQDAEAGKPGLEFQALIGTVVEIAGWTQTPIPTLSVVYDLIRMKENSLQRANKL